MPLHKSIIIAGSGPTGLGAAHRLHELRHDDWLLLEASNHAGGLAASFVDEKGFTWDIGGHVQFSHYEYFDRAMIEFLGADGWLRHQRESWVWMRDRFIPYPLQNNIHRLPVDDLNRCLQGLLDVTQSPRPKPANFGQWIDATFGSGLAEIFMRPYNYKVWAYPPEELNAGWVGERVALPDFARAMNNLILDKDDLSWGPNTTFQFPKSGGTGAIWRACAQRLPQDKLHFETPISSIDLERHELSTKDGRVLHYDHLISTLPLRELIRLTGQKQLEPFSQKGLLYSSSNIFGLGLRGKPAPELASKCWIYFPEDNCPFYRVTVFSNYSPNNVPDINQYWSLLAEVSESPLKPVNQEKLLDEVIQGALSTRLISSRAKIVSTWNYRAQYGYPTPGLHRDEALARIIPFFENHHVYSRGRFGLWKYEVSNQDHSFMQGVEMIDRLLNGRAEVTAQIPKSPN
ncbi:MAG TPA: FAD-dependent oxidoreductase [Verrucomicrobiae bacterium]|jgi:protoporphyrinogen oxidase|nr:FAD-dependent oxidoreductase [Verrucomicrobiae bacterium]